MRIFLVCFLFLSGVCLKAGAHFSKADTNGLSLKLDVLNNNEIRVTVKNISKKVIMAYSYVKTYENHYDYFEVEAQTPDGDKIFLSFVADREQSAPVIVELKPGESFSHKINLKQWAERPINSKSLKDAGLNHLPNGIKIRAKYLKQPCSDCSEYYKSIWSGYIYSDWQKF